MSWRTARRERAGLLAPAAILLALAVVLPVGRLLALSFQRTDAEAGLRSSFAGADMYVRLAQDGRFWTALANTAVFTLVSVGLEMVLGIGFALLLHRRFAGRRWVRAAVLLPWVLPTAIMALAWGWIFNDSFGVWNDLLGRAGLVHGPVAWLGGPVTAMFAMIVADVWKTTPFVALVVLAGLAGIPASVIDAARVEGASGLRLLWHIVLPLARPACVVALALRSAQAFGTFDLPYVLTGGGPGGATETVSLYAYRSFYRYLDFGYGAALAVVGAAIALLGFALLLRLARRTGEGA